MFWFCFCDCGDDYHKPCHFVVVGLALALVLSLSILYFVTKCSCLGLAVVCTIFVHGLEIKDGTMLP